MEVNEKIKQYLEEHGISQAFVIRVTGIHRNRVGRIVNGKAKLTAAELGLIAKALNVSADIFLK
ncbi:MAG: helix-turn-helix transcriptional regulator [Roseburia sp.]|nr:helix-turn-helix transcriptional regulator [Anaeroplasma bactoclasticum]MCM1195519.1 helix-turn-helix transcriptional regulator [Roseburia sp.]MCM1556895.1 helix-turn-helix transcriptional regulator [Anaeroplasma bactoclasticum]